MTLKDFEFPKLRGLKTWLGKCLNIPRGPFKGHHGKLAQILLKFASQHHTY